MSSAQRYLDRPLEVGDALGIQVVGTGATSARAFQVALGPVDDEEMHGRLARDAKAGQDLDDRAALGLEDADLHVNGAPLGADIAAGVQPAGAGDARVQYLQHRPQAVRAVVDRRHRGPPGGAGRGALGDAVLAVVHQVAAVVNVLGLGVDGPADVTLAHQVLVGLHVGHVIHVLREHVLQARALDGAGQRLGLLQVARCRHLTEHVLAVLERLDGVRHVDRKRRRDHDGVYVRRTELRVVVEVHGHVVLLSDLLSPVRLHIADRRQLAVLVIREHAHKAHPAAKAGYSNSKRHDGSP